MEAASDARLRPRERLTKSADYAKVLRRGVRLDGRLFNLSAAPNQQPHHRLGLTVSRGIVEGAGGSLRHESPGSGGARFVVSLPAAGPGGVTR